MHLPKFSDGSLVYITMEDSAVVIRFALSSWTCTTSSRVFFLSTCRLQWEHLNLQEAIVNIDSLGRDVIGEGRARTCCLLTVFMHCLQIRS